MSYDLENTWLEAWDRVYDIIVAITGLGVTRVVKGFCANPPVPGEGGVLVMVGPGTNEPISQDTHGDYHKMTFLVYIFTDEQDIVKATEDVIHWSGKIRKALVADRTLGGLVNDTTPTRAITNPPVVPGYERQMISLAVECKTWIDDP